MLLKGGGEGVGTLSTPLLVRLCVTINIAIKIKPGSARVLLGGGLHIKRAGVFKGSRIKVLVLLAWHLILFHP